ncbi:4'-phosphopantetheinyl transferase family protein [Kitasatospora sp. NBC_01266]|uniref:4'-phosphopantetheinyl transferase family protein n=1 Tax=Kitasatospora sp. NBC_01266 TaxID=2903572 RepID=UPI002E2FA8B7|nr:4'-phosphopantetheinyl transferase superfamily protein [Kitasatospora sp. NBC_01266]
MTLAQPAAGAQRLAPPEHVAGPESLWDPVCDRMADTGRAVVHTTWGEWLTAALFDPELRRLLGPDWPRYRQTPAAVGRFRFAVARLVVKYTAAAVLQVSPGDLDLAYKPGGRPYLRGIGEELELSLSHTDELIVVGVSRTGPIGVDAEPAARRVSFELLREQVCTAREAEAISALPEQERAAEFLRLWTLKEAYTKALGHGMRRRFGAFGFTWYPDGSAELTEDSPTAHEWAFATHLVQGRYLVSEAHRRLGGVEVRLRWDPEALEETDL